MEPEPEEMVPANPDFDGEDIGKHLLTLSEEVERIAREDLLDVEDGTDEGRQ